MVKLGDLASSTGKSFDQLAEAVLDAQTGEFERLKEFGIKASANGDKVTFSFKEQKTTVENAKTRAREGGRATETIKLENETAQRLQRL